MLIAGIDDAGRGSVIGPLVIAGVLMKKENLPKLTHLGVKDSKYLSPSKREILFFEIKGIAQKIRLIMLSPKEIDNVVLHGKKLFKLNRLEAQTMAKVIELLKPDMAYVDASDVNEERFKIHIIEYLPYIPEIISEHKADRTYPIVSAASIVAKVERDRVIAKLREEYGDFGSGYPSDRKTKIFLQEFSDRFGKFPNFVRKSWKTVKQIKKGLKKKVMRLQ